MNANADVVPLRRPEDARAPVSVLVVDDHPAVRVGVESVLGAEADLTVLASVATAREAFTEVEHGHPRVAVVDYHLGDRDGLTVTRRLKMLDPSVRVLVYSAYADATLTVAAIVAGADGIVHKGGDGDELCGAVRAVAAGRRAYPAVTPAALATIGARLDADDIPILGMLIHGTPPDEVARTLGISHEWLSARRWAMVQRLLRRPPGRRSGGPRSDGLGADLEC